MKYKFLIISSVLIFFLLQTDISISQNKVKTVVIDAGHGGKDPGAIAAKKYEKDITLAIALKVGNYITKNVPGVKVIYTRDDDTFVKLFRRSEIANENNADLFISIHVNASKNKNIKGTSTFVMGMNKAEKNIEVAKNENNVILQEVDYKSNYEGFDPNSPETEIILHLVQSAYFDNSIILATKIQNQLRDKAMRTDRGVKQAGLIVLWNCTMPSVLVETGFITNSTERKYLTSDYGQSLIASAIYRSFKEYKYQIEKTKPEEKIENKKITPDKQDKAVVIYKVQIASSPKKLELKHYNFKGIRNVSCYKEGAKYRYTVGNSKNLDEIKKLKIQVRKKYPDAFITAFKNNKKIPF